MCGSIFHAPLLHLPTRAEVLAHSCIKRPSLITTSGLDFCVGGLALDYIRCDISIPPLMCLDRVNENLILRSGAHTRTDQMSLSSCIQRGLEPIKYFFFTLQAQHKGLILHNFPRDQPIVLEFDLTLLTHE